MSFSPLIGLLPSAKKTFLLYLNIFPSFLSLMMRLIRTGYGSMGEDLSRGVWAFCQQPHHWIKCLSLHQLFSWSSRNSSPLHDRIPTESVLCSSSPGDQLLRVQGCNSHAMSRGQWYTKSPPPHYCWFLRPLCLRLEIFMTLWVGGDRAVPFMAEH